MKKRIFGIVAVVLFMSPNLNASILIEVDCWDAADQVELAYNQATGNTDPYVSFPVWQAAFDACNGENTPGTGDID